MKKQALTDMRDFDNITEKLRDAVKTHPYYGEFLEYTSRHNYYSITDQLAASKKFANENIGTVFLQAGKQSVRTHGNLHALLALIAKREKSRAAIEKPRKNTRGKGYSESRDFPIYWPGMSTEQYVSQYLNIGYKPFSEESCESCEHRRKRNEDWFRDKQIKLSFFQPLNTHPATIYDNTYPEVTEEICDSI